MRDTDADVALSPVEPARHETRDISIAAVVWFAGALLAIALVVHIGIWLLVEYFAARERAADPPRPPMTAGESLRLPPEPRLQTAPADDLRSLVTEEQQLIESYGWVDRDGGIVRIPIERAIELLAERGLPARGEKK